jgi:hypothetical protein
MITMILPPQGRDYGFPKRITDLHDYNENPYEWLRSQGYPEGLITYGIVCDFWHEMEEGE